MEFIKQNRVAIATAVVIAAVIGVVWINQQSADSNKQKTDEQTVQQKKDKQAADKKAAADKKEQTEKSRDYSYTAAAGDSYTAFARTSVQAFAKANDSSLSKAQIIAAETMLAQKAQSPFLNIGDRVTISHENLKEAVDAAEKLSKNQLAIWQQYVPYVDFS